MQSTPVADYIVLGENCARLHSLKPDMPEALWYDVCGRIEQTLKQATELGVSVPIQQIEHFILSMNREVDENRLPNGNLSQEQCNWLRSLIHPIFELCYIEGKKRQSIILKTSEVSAKLRELPKTLPKMNAAHTHFWEETVRCLECEGYRAAVVMAWTLGYDYIRQWVFDNKKADFNIALLANYLRKDGKSPVYDPINDYEDFFTGPTEHIVLETCKYAGIFGERVYDALRERLRERNNYAHASADVPSPNTCNAYIEYLIKIISAKPFG